MQGICRASASDPELPLCEDDELKQLFFLWKMNSLRLNTCYFLHRETQLSANIMGDRCVLISS